MEIIKNISAIIGVTLSAVSLFVLLSKTARNAIINLFKKYGKSEEVSKSISEIKEMLEQHIQEEKEFKDSITKMNEISIEFTKTQCRNIIKSIFYHYKDTKVLPLYEKKTLMNVEDLYINRLHGNSFAGLLIEEMSGWEVDYESSDAEKEE